MSPLVSILIPNYKTLTLTKLCLRLLRKNTPPGQAEVIVIDNDSADESLTYLRRLPWIQLIERKKVPGETPVQAHARSLDLALTTVTTPFVLSIHTDTLIKNPAWLDFLLAQINKRPNIAGVGSWKLEDKSFLQKILKTIERKLQLLYFTWRGETSHAIEGVGKNYYYLRSHCALYRNDLLKKYNLHFADGDMVAGKKMHEQLILHGHEMLFLPSDVLINYLEHINHATSVLNSELSTRQKSVDKGLIRIEKSLKRMQANLILQDTTLDF